MSKIFIISGEFGSGKSVLSYSFIPNDWDGKSQIHRLVLDPEIRYETYLSKDGKDHPKKLMFAFTPLSTGIVTPQKIQEMFGLIHNKTYKERPNVISLDDVALIQDTMIPWWADKNNALLTAKLYDLTGHRNLTMSTWKPNDPGTGALFKLFFQKFMLDCKDQNINLVLTSPMRNLWQNYGQAGYAEDHLPKMRITGRSAKVLDCWLQMADVVWVLDRKDKNGKLVNIPIVKMDVHIPKASLPGVPESFTWPGWIEVWKWHDERKFVADPTKIPIPAPEFDQDTMERAIQDGKRKLVNELKGKVTIDEIVKAMSHELAPVYTLAGHEEVKTFILQWKEEQEKNKEPKTEKGE